MNIIVQWMLNVLVLGGVTWLWYESKKLRASNLDSGLRETLTSLESRIGVLETEFETLRQQLEDKNKILDAVSEQLQRALKNQKLTGLGYPITQEESDLKEAIYLGVEKDEIPSVVQFQSTKLRLQNENSLDLKTLLKGQLS